MVTYRSARVRGEIDWASSSAVGFLRSLSLHMLLLSSAVEDCVGASSGGLFRWSCSGTKISSGDRPAAGLGGEPPPEFE